MFTFCINVYIRSYDGLICIIKIKYIIINLKSKVYKKKPRTTVDMKQNIRDEVAAISPTMLQRVMQNFQKRLREYVDNKGHHLTDTIFRK